MGYPLESVIKPKSKKNDGNTIERNRKKKGCHISNDNRDYINSLAEEYRLPRSWIRRGFLAASICRIDPEFFVRKYVRQERLPPNPIFQAVFTDILKDEANAEWGRMTEITNLRVAKRRHLKLKESFQNRF